MVGYDGTISACCNQDVIDGPVPDHLRIGHALTDDWPTIRARYRSRAMLRALRTYGPHHLADRFGSPPLGQDSFCNVCRKLSDEPAVAREVEALFERETTRWIEARVQELSRQQSQFVARQTPAEYAHLITLGQPEAEEQEVRHGA